MYLIINMIEFLKKMHNVKFFSLFLEKLRI